MISDRAAWDARRRLAGRVAIVVAIAAGAWALVLVRTGGFDTSLAGLTITAHEPRRPLLISAVGATLWLVCGGAAFLWRAWVFVCGRVSQRALVAAFALAVTVTGLHYSVSVGGGTDSLGYVSEADLFLQGHLWTPQPFARQVPWPDARWTFAPLGYVPGDDDFDLVPRYAAGLPMLMAVGKVIAGQRGMFAVVPIAGGVLVFATYLLALRLGLGRAGVIAAALVATSPTVLYMLNNAMSDVPVAAAWTLALWLMLGSGRAAALSAGMAAAIAVLIRPNLAPQVLVFAAWYGWRARHSVGSWRERAAPLLSFAAGLAPGLIGVAALNWFLHGSPVKSGYGSLDVLYDRSNVWVNLRLYANWIFETQTPLALAGLVVVLLPIRTFWSAATSRVSVGMLSLFVALLWWQYCAYAIFDAWWYLRFLLPCWPMMMLGLGRVIDLASGRWPPVVRLAVVGAVVLLSVRGIGYAESRYSFTMRNGEWKYAAVAQAIRQRTDRNSLILSMQHSGTIRYYGGRMTLMYPALEADWLDRALAWCRDHGIHPYAALEEWELPEFRKAFPGQTAGALADPPRFVYRGPSTVYFYDFAPPPTPMPTEFLTETYGALSFAAPAPAPHLEIR